MNPCRRSHDNHVIIQPHHFMQSQPMSPAPLQSCCHRQSNNSVYYDCAEEKSAPYILSPSSTSSLSYTSSWPTQTSDSPQVPPQAYFSPYRRTRASSSPSPRTVSTETVHECCAQTSAQPPLVTNKMGLSKTQRICILLGIDAVFFLIELVCGQSQPFPCISKQHGLT
jgi:hypothetical protein